MAAHLHGHSSRTLDACTGPPQTARVHLNTFCLPVALASTRLLSLVPLFPGTQVFRPGSEIRFWRGYQFVPAPESSHLPLHNTSFTMALALGSRQIGRVGAKAPARSVRANAASRPLWRPGSTPPAHLKGE
jgi:hypothetical protein